MTTPAGPFSTDPELAAGLPPAGRAAYFPAGAGGHQIIQGRGLLLGWANHNTDGAAGHLVYFRDGSDNKGQIIAISRMGNSASDTGNTGFYGVEYLSGLFADDPSGLLEGTVWFLPL